MHRRRWPRRASAPASPASPFGAADLAAVLATGHAGAARGGESDPVALERGRPSPPAGRREWASSRPRLRRGRLGDIDHHGPGDFLARVGTRQPSSRPRVSDHRTGRVVDSRAGARAVSGPPARLGRRALPSAVPSVATEAVALEDGPRAVSPPARRDRRARPGGQPWSPPPRTRGKTARPIPAARGRQPSKDRQRTRRSRGAGRFQSSTGPNDRCFGPGPASARWRRGSEARPRHRCRRRPGSRGPRGGLPHVESGRSIAWARINGQKDVPLTSSRFPQPELSTTPRAWSFNAQAQSSSVRNSAPSISSAFRKPR